MQQEMWCVWVCSGYLHLCILARSKTLRLTDRKMSVCEITSMIDIQHKGCNMDLSFAFSPFICMLRHVLISLSRHKYIYISVVYSVVKLDATEIINRSTEAVSFPSLLVWSYLTHFFFLFFFSDESLFSTNKGNPDPTHKWLFLWKTAVSCLLWMKFTWRSWREVGGCGSQCSRIMKVDVWLHYLSTVHGMKWHLMYCQSRELQFLNTTIGWAGEFWAVWRTVSEMFCGAPSLPTRLTHIELESDIENCTLYLDGLEVANGVNVQWVSLNFYSAWVRDTKVNMEMRKDLRDTEIQYLSSRTAVAWQQPRHLCYIKGLLALALDTIQNLTLQSSIEPQDTATSYMSICNVINCDLTKETSMETKMHSYKCYEKTVEHAVIKYYITV